MMNNKLNREELAALEVGYTTVSRSLSRVIVFCFLVLIISVPMLQLFLDQRNPEQLTFLSSLQTLLSENSSVTSEQHSFVATVKERNNRLLEAMDDFEKQIEEKSFLRDQLLAPGQRLLLGLGYGNEKVYPGRAEWLFYRPDMDYLMGPAFLDPTRLKQRRESGKLWESPVQPDPISTILEFNRQLSSRGIQLILMPTPIKATIYPEFFNSGEYSVPVQNSSWDTFVSLMEEASIPLFDPAPILLKQKQKSAIPAYLRTDTHWSSGAMETVAVQLSQYIQEKVPLSENLMNLTRRKKEVTNQGDIDAMLLLPEEWELYAEEQTEIHTVVTAANEMWQAATDAEILLLGDSFSNIYSLSGMGWGEGAGLGEQLSYSLKRPVDLILQNDSGAYATREMLSRELARGRDRLAGKKVLIWQFATRELSSGDWKRIPMELKEKPESLFYTPAPGETKNVTGIITAISRSPLPGSVPYKDNIITLLLEDIRDSDTEEVYGRALVYGWGMKENTLMPFAKNRIGEKISVKLIDWDMVQGQYSSYRRSTLDDEMLELELPVWGEILP